MGRITVGERTSMPWWEGICRKLNPSPFFDFHLRGNCRLSSHQSLQNCAVNGLYKK